MLLSAYRIPSRSPFHVAFGASLPRRHCGLGYCDLVILYLSMWGMLSCRYQFRYLAYQDAHPGNQMVYGVHSLLTSREAVRLPTHLHFEAVFHPLASTAFRSLSGNCRITKSL